MLRNITCLAVLFLSCASLHAQVQPYNPYAPEIQDTIPVTPDGKINWPTFYRSTKLKNKFQLLHAMGSCMGTAKDIVSALEANKVDVNALGTRTVHGKLVAMHGGAFTVLDKSGETTTVMTHPAGVSRVDVDGSMPIARLRPGMAVRLTTQVDARGQAQEPVEALNVFTFDRDTQPDAVTPGRVQTIAGWIRNIRGSHVQVHVNAGRLRQLTFLLADDCRISVTGHELQLLSPGDEVEVTGHVYSRDKQLGRIVFANKVEAATRHQLAERTEDPDAVTSVTR
jgi:hypothetical protein